MFRYGSLPLPRRRNYALDCALAHSHVCSVPSPVPSSFRQTAPGYKQSRGTNSPDKEQWGHAVSPLKIKHAYQKTTEISKTQYVRYIRQLDTLLHYTNNNKQSQKNHVTNVFIGLLQIRDARV